MTRKKEVQKPGQPKRSHHKKPASPKAASSVVAAPAAMQINRIAIVVDESGSMGSLYSETVKALNSQIDAIKEQAKAPNQETFVSLYTFDSGIMSDGYKLRIKEHFFNLPAAQIRNNMFAYRPAGGTPLLGSVAHVINRLKTLADGSNVSYLLVVLTDGEENTSKITSVQFRQLMADVVKTDRWSFAFLVPPGSYSKVLACNFNIPAGNIKAWEATSAGLKQASVDTHTVFSNYYATRSRGETKSSNLFETDLSKVSKTQVRQNLIDLSNKVTVVTVDRDDDISGFCVRVLGGYAKGNAFYQLIKDEKVQNYKQVMLKERVGSGKVYGGVDARDILGLPNGQDVKVRPGNHKDWDIYIQSTSTNRKLVPGTKLIYFRGMVSQ